MFVGLAINSNNLTIFGSTEHIASTEGDDILSTMHRQRYNTRNPTEVDRFWAAFMLQRHTVLTRLKLSLHSYYLA
ncbi:hypothetical protein HMPREF3042_00125 [Corynebacterium sp. HMSC074C05]|nr:hypothetical protein HMPREF3042_00125 [Corynebacterium sp. HMSC074C05]